MQVDIPPHCGALPVSGDGLRLRRNGQSGAAHQTDDEDLHIGLTNILVSRLFQFRLPEDVPQAGGKFRTFKMVQNAELSVGIGSRGQLDALDAQHDVFQRLGAETDFRVGHVGIDDHQIVGVDGISPVFDEKLTLSAHDEEQLHMVVGMGHGVPVPAVGGPGHIQKLRRAPDDVGLLPVETVMTSAHIGASCHIFYDYWYYMLKSCDSQPKIKDSEEKKKGNSSGICTTLVGSA